MLRRRPQSELFPRELGESYTYLHPPSIDALQTERWQGRQGSPHGPSAGSSSAAWPVAALNSISWRVSNSGMSRVFPEMLGAGAID